MDIKVRFYTTHDLDLNELKSREGFDMGTQIKKALRAFVRNKAFTVNIPDKKPSKDYKKNDCIALRFNSSEDQDIIDFIKNIHPGYRNSLIKNILRLYIPVFNIEPYMVPEWTGRKEFTKNEDKKSFSTTEIKEDDKKTTETVKGNVVSSESISQEQAKKETETSAKESINADEDDDFDYIAAFANLIPPRK